MTLPSAEAARIARESVEAQLPRWWRGQRRTRLMRAVDEYAEAFAEGAMDAAGAAAGEGTDEHGDEGEPVDRRGRLTRE